MTWGRTGMKCLFLMSGNRKTKRLPQMNETTSFISRDDPALGGTTLCRDDKIRTCDP